MKTFNKYLKIEIIIFKLSFLQFIEYRMDTIVGLIGSVFWISGFMLTLEIIFSHVPLIGIWDKWDVIMLFSIAQLYSGIFFFATLHNMQILSDNISSGKFNIILTKPISSIFFGTLTRFNINVLFIFPLEFTGIFLYAILHKNFDINIINIFLFIVTFLITCIIGHVISIIFTTANFWFTNSGMQEAFGLTNDIMQYPMEIIGNKYIRGIFLTIIPYALLINVPFRALIGELSWQLLLLQIAVMIIFIIIANITWRKGVQAYESVGG